MTVCSVKRCYSTSEKQKKSDQITFHNFPVDPVIADRWIQTLRRNRKQDWWKPSKNTKICSMHFRQRDKYLTKQGMQRIRRGAVPTKRLFLSSSESDSENSDNSKKPHHRCYKRCVDNICTESFAGLQQSTSTSQSSKRTIAFKPAPDEIMSRGMADENKTAIVLTEKVFHKEPEPCTSTDQLSEVTIIIKPEPDEITSDGIADENKTAIVLTEKTFHTEPKRSISTSQPTKVTIVIKPDPDDSITDKNETAILLTEKTYFHEEPVPSTSTSQPSKVTNVIKPDPDEITSVYGIADETETAKVHNEKTFYKEPEPSTSTGEPSEVTIVIKPEPDEISSDCIADENKAAIGLTEKAFNQKTDSEIDTSDLDSICDTAREHKLRQELRRKSKLQIKHTKLIKNLKQENRRLKNRVSSLKETVKNLKKQKYV